MLILATQAPGVPDPAAGGRARLRVAVNCRIDADRLAVGPEDEAPGALVLRGAAPLSDAQLRCYGGTITEAGVTPSIDDERLSRRYDTLRRQDMGTSARMALQQEGLLAQLPRRARGEPLGRYARRLERLCGARAGSVLQVEDGQIRLAESGDAEPSGEESRGWLCTFSAAVAAGHDPLTIPPPPPIPVPDIPAAGG